MWYPTISLTHQQNHRYTSDGLIPCSLVQDKSPLRRSGYLHRRRTHLLCLPTQSSNIAQLKTRTPYPQGYIVLRYKRGTDTAYYKRTTTASCKAGIVLRRCLDLHHVFYWCLGCVLYRLRTKMQLLDGSSNVK